MKKDEKEILEQVILERIVQTKEDIETFGKLSQPVSPDNAIGRITRMEAINSKEMNEASLAKSRQTLAQLQKALKMLDDPDFGYCKICEEEIPYKRLMIMPETPFCVSCAGRVIKG